MMHIQSLPFASESTFGRDGAMFESLLGFVAQLSLVLWSLVILTAVVRFVGMRMYRRSAAGKVLGSNLPSDAATSAGVEAVQPVKVPAAVVASVALPRNAARKRNAVQHIQVLDTAHVYELASNTAKA